MELDRIYTTQRRLRNAGQVAEMVSTLAEGGTLPAVMIGELDDGTCFICDGHHRCLAYHLSGRKKLSWGEFLLLPGANPRSLRGRITTPEVVRRLLDDRSSRPSVDR